MRLDEEVQRTRGCMPRKICSRASLRSTVFRDVKPRSADWMRVAASSELNPCCMPGQMRISYTYVLSNDPDWCILFEAGQCLTA
jgi:hypothetical protein